MVRPLIVHNKGRKTPDVMMYITHYYIIITPGEGDSSYFISRRSATPGDEAATLSVSVPYSY